MHKMAFQDAPRENLQTWDGVIKLLVYGAASTAVFLLLLAWFMT